MSTLRHYFRLSIDSDQGREALRRNCTKLTLQILALHLVRAAVTQLVQYHFSQSGTGGPSFALSSSRRRCSCARSAGSGACATNLSNRSLFCVIIQCSRAIFGIAQTPSKPGQYYENGLWEQFKLPRLIGGCAQPIILSAAYEVQGGHHSPPAHLIMFSYQLGLNPAGTNVTLNVMLRPRHIGGQGVYLVCH